MNIDQISGTKVDEFKGFLRLHGLNLYGKKQELVTRVLMVAIEMMFRWSRRQKKFSISLPMTIKGNLSLVIVINDPFNLKDGWLSEENGTKF